MRRAINVFYRGYRISSLRSFSDLNNSKPFLFSAVEGQIDTSHIFPYPQILNSEDIEMLNIFKDQVERFFQTTNNPMKNEEQGMIEEESMKVLKELGVLGLMVPEKYGGLGMNNTQYGNIVYIGGKYDIALGVVSAAHQAIGYKGILLFGNEQQKMKYLPKLAKGEWLASFCLTEPGAGSDVQSLQTKAVLSSDGKHYILNGSKMWITNGREADIYTVFARTLVTDKDGNQKEKLSSFIVERAFGGVIAGHPDGKMGIKCARSVTLFFEDCKVPVENLLGELGAGFKIAMKILNNGRFAMASGTSGTMRTCIEKASQHAMNRKQFDTQIKNFKVIQEKLAVMQVKQFITESMAVVISSNMDRGISSYKVESALAKVYSSESAWFCVDEAIQVMGGTGYMQEYGLEKIMRDLRIFKIFEGTNEVLRLMAVGVCLKHLSDSTKSSSRYVVRQLRNKCGLNYAFNVAALKKVVDPSLYDSVPLLAKAITLTSADINAALIKHRMKLMTNESSMVSRFANCLIEIYSMACVLSRATNSIRNVTIEASEMTAAQAEHERTLAKLACTLGLETVIVELRRFRMHDNGLLNDFETVSEDLCLNGGCLNKYPVEI